MRAGTLVHRIALQRKTSTYSSSGDAEETWSTLATRWAAVSPQAGDPRSEREGQEQLVAREHAVFSIRWTADVDDFSPVDRIIFPASDASVSPVPSRSVYDVLSVIEKVPRDQIDVLAMRRVG